MTYDLLEFREQVPFVAIWTEVINQIVNCHFQNFNLSSGGEDEQISGGGNLN